MENNNAPVAEEKTAPVRMSHSREPLFGVLLLILIIILILGFVAGLGWTGYSTWKMAKEKDNQPSIATLEEKKEEAPKEEVKPIEKEASKEVPTTDPSITKAKETSITVMNGGAAKGSAGTLMEALKKDGYSKVTTGNTLADYKGTVIYFGTGLDKEAEAVKTSILKAYPQATVKPAESTNKETSVTPLTIILGQ